MLLDREQAIRQGFIFDHNCQAVAADDPNLAVTVFLQVIS